MMLSLCRCCLSGCYSKECSCSIVSLRVSLDPEEDKISWFRIYFTNSLNFNCFHLSGEIRAFHFPVSEPLLDQKQADVPDSNVSTRAEDKVHDVNVSTRVEIKEALNNVTTSRLNGLSHHQRIIMLIFTLQLQFPRWTPLPPVWHQESQHRSRPPRSQSKTCPSFWWQRPCQHPRSQPDPVSKVPCPPSCWILIRLEVSHSKSFLPSPCHVSEITLTQTFRNPSRSEPDPLQPAESN